MALALVSVSYPWIETTEFSKNILQKILEISDIVEITSIFKRNSAQGGEFQSRVEFVTAVSTRYPSLEFSKKLAQINDAITKNRSDSKVEIHLLIYDQEIVMTPELTLPHPNLHYDNLTLRLACEIWSQFEHPILKKTLREMADQRNEELNVEFIMQGQNLFD